jgi:hypothetical protein
VAEVPEVVLADAGKLGVAQIDLLILHQALPSAFERTLEAYRALGGPVGQPDRGTQPSSLSASKEHRMAYLTGGTT